MREIKFRAYNTKEKTMGDPFTLQTAIGSRLHDGVDTEGVEYMQFTGLHDKNGKEIFEGDIVKGEWDVVNDIYISSVDFRGSSFSIEKTGLPLQWGYAYKECEIIGNIYSNPELLTNEKV